MLWRQKGPDRIWGYISETQINDWWDRELRWWLGGCGRINRSNIIGFAIPVFLHFWILYRIDFSSSLLFLSIIADIFLYLSYSSFWNYLSQFSFSDFLSISVSLSLSFFLSLHPYCSDCSHLLQTQNWSLLLPPGANGGLIRYLFFSFSFGVDVFLSFFFLVCFTIK